VSVTRFLTDLAIVLEAGAKFTDKERLRAAKLCRDYATIAMNSEDAAEEQHDSPPLVATTSVDAA